LDLPSTTDAGSSPSDRDRFSNAPISRLVGFDVLPGEPGTATVVCVCESRHHNPMARVHGGMLAMLADAAMGIAFGRTLDRNQEFATIELHVHFIRPVIEGRVEARAKLRKRGLRIGFVECELFGPEERLVATAQCTCTIVGEV